MNMKVYYVKGCKITNKFIFSGYVMNVNDEPIITSIKRKFGMNNILCELTNEGFDYDQANIYSVPLTELSLGDFLLITGIING